MGKCLDVEELERFWAFAVTHGDNILTGVTVSLTIFNETVREATRTLTLALTNATELEHVWGVFVRQKVVVV